MEEQLYSACRDGKVEDVIILLQNSSININWQDPEFSETSFYIACQNGDIEIVELLVKNCRVDLNYSCSQDGTTPITISILNGHLNVIQSILVTKRNCFVSSSLHQAIEIAKKTEYDEIIQLLTSLQNDPEETQKNLRKHFKLPGFFSFSFSFSF